MAAPPAADAGVVVRPPADAAPPDRCGGYALAVAPVLGRIGRAADGFLDRVGQAHAAAEIVRAADALAAELSGEQPALDAIHTSDAELDAAHARLAAALVALAQAVRDLSAAYQDERRVAARKAAAPALDRAIQKWSEAVAGIQRVCPGIE